MKLRLQITENYFSHNGTLYKDTVVVTKDDDWKNKDVVKVTDLSGKIYRLDRKYLSNLHQS